MEGTLTLQQSKDRFVQFGQCFHYEEFEEEVEIPNTNVVQVMCGVCNKVKREYYK